MVSVWGFSVRDVTSLHTLRGAVAAKSSQRRPGHREGVEGVSHIRVRRVYVSSVHSLKNQIYIMIYHDFLINVLNSRRFYVRDPLRTVHTVWRLRSRRSDHHSSVFVEPSFTGPSPGAIDDGRLGVLAAAATIWPRPTPRDVDTWRRAQKTPTETMILSTKEIS
jgi:hypothetical protein